MLLLLRQGIRSRYLFNHIVILPHNDGNLVFLVSSLIPWKRWPFYPFTLRCPSVSLYLFPWHILLYLLFWLFLGVFSLLVDLSFWSIVVVLLSVSLLGLLDREFIDVFSETFSGSHLIFAHKVRKVFQKLWLHFVKLQFRDFVLIS